MRALAVVVDAPFFDFDASTSERRETRLRKTLVAEVAIERLDVGILSRLPGLDEIQLHAVRVRPLLERYRNEFRPVIDAKALRKSVKPNQFIEDSDDAGRGQRRVDLDREALARKGINDIEHADLAAISQVVVNEVHRPTLVRARHESGRHGTDRAKFPTVATLHGQAGCAIDAVYTLAFTS